MIEHFVQFYENEFTSSANGGVLSAASKRETRRRHPTKPHRDDLKTAEAEYSRMAAQQLHADR